MLVSLLLFSHSASVLAVGECDRWRNAKAKVQNLEDTVGALKKEREALTDKLARLRSSGGTAPVSSPEIGRLEGVVRANGDAVTQQQATLTGIQSELTRATKERARIDADIAAAELLLKQEQAVDALEKRFSTDPDVARLRDEQSRLKARFRTLFGDRNVDEVAALLNKENPSTPANDPVFENTNVGEIARAFARRKHFKDPPRTEFGAKLDAPEWDEDRLNKEDGRLRLPLKTLVSRLQLIPGELRQAEDKLMNAQERIWRARRESTESTTESAKRNLARLRASREENASELERLRESVQKETTALKGLEKKLSDSKVELDRERAKASPVAKAEAELDRVEAALEKGEEALAAAKKELYDAEGALRSLFQEFAAFMRSADQSYDQAKATTTQATCEPLRSAALSALRNASAKAADIGACDPTRLDPVRQKLGEVAALDCGPGPQPTGLIEVPPVSGRKWDAVEGLLRSRGLTGPVSIWELRAPENEGEKGTAIHTDPPAGTMVPPANAVTVFIRNKKYVDPGKAAAPVSATSGDWDEEARKARVTSASVAVKTQEPPSAAAGQRPADSTQAERAKEIADNAVSKGPTADPVFNPQAIATMIGTIAGMAGTVARDKAGGYPGAQPGIRDIGSKPLPGVIPRTGTAADSKAAAPSSPMKCVIHRMGQGNAHYLIEYPGRPVGFEIRRVSDPPPPRSNEALTCGTTSGAMKRCIQREFVGRPVVVRGPFRSDADAEQEANARCR